MTRSPVVGRPVEGNEEVVAFVLLLQGSAVKSADLMTFVNPQLTSYKRRSEIIVLDALPATSTGEILKHKLAESPVRRATAITTRHDRRRLESDRFNLTGEQPCRRETQPWP